MNIIPGKLPLSIQPGVDFQITLNLTAAGAAIPVDAYAPFTSQIKTRADGPLLATIAVDSSDAAGGLLVLTLAGELTANLRGRAVYDVLDSAGRRWIQGAVTFDPSVTDLP
jgi:hypothetical protein